MKVFITGICGFVGSALAEALLEFREGISIFAVDNLQRPGSEMNRGSLRSLSLRVVRGDIRMASDFEGLPPADWVIDAAGQPKRVGRSERQRQQQLFEHNLASLVNVLRLLGSPAYSALKDLRRRLPFGCLRDSLPRGVSELGVGPGFSTAAPVSLYGSTKLQAISWPWNTARRTIFQCG